MNKRVPVSGVNNPRNWGEDIAQIRDEYARRIMAGEVQISVFSDKTPSSSVYMDAVQTVKKAANTEES